MNRWSITNPWVFFGIGGALVAYLLYMMVRRRKGERAGVTRSGAGAVNGRKGWYGMGNLWNRLGSDELPVRVEHAAGPGGVVGAGGRAGRDHRAVFPQAEAAAGAGAEHAPLAAEPGGPARQQPVPAAAAEPAPVPPAPGRGAGDAGPGRPADQGDGRDRAAVRPDDRQLGEHVGHRRRAQPAGPGQGGGEEGRRRDGRRRPGDGDRLLRLGAGRVELHGRPAAC